MKSWLGRGLHMAGAAAVGAGAGYALTDDPLLIGASAAAIGVAHSVMFSPVPTKTPVVMLHSVAPDLPGRPAPFSLWCPPEMFEGYLKYLRWRGYTTITLKQLYDHIKHGTAIPAKPIVLTFDDGYLDNWVYAAPLLEKYGMCGTVFMPSDFVQPGETVRPTIKEVWAGRARATELPTYGYLNRAELRQLAQSGLLDIQSHGRTHTWLPTSERIVEFHHPGLKMRHLRPTWWNAHTERKPFWFEEISHEGLPWGAPIYENKLALSARAVQPDPRLGTLLTGLVAAAGGREFFTQPDWRAQLERQVADFRRDNPPHAQPEETAAFTERLRWELAGSREQLEAICGTPVQFMCWPNGGTCPEAFALLESTGYLGATLPSRAKQPQNHAGTRPDRLGRVSATSYFRGTRKVFPWVFSFATKIERNRGNRYMEFPIKAIWLYRQFVKPGGDAPPGAEE